MTKTKRFYFSGMAFGVWRCGVQNSHNLSQQPLTTESYWSFTLSYRTITIRIPIMLAFHCLLILLLCVSLSLAQKEYKTECLPSNEDYSSFYCLPYHSEGSRIKCLDSDTQCENWAKSGECNKNAQFMLIHCRKSCDSCVDLHHGSVLQIAPAGDADEKMRKEILQMLVETQQYIHTKADQSVTALTKCVNKDSSCTYWSLKGECHSNAQFMNRECAAACKTCEKNAKT
jgi:hypothetical protein